MKTQTAITVLVFAFLNLMVAAQSSDKQEVLIFLDNCFSKAQSNLDSMIVEVNRLEPMVENLKDTSLLLGFCHCKGKILWYNKEIEKSLNVYKKMVGISDKAGNPKYQIISRDVLHSSYSELGKVDSAYIYLLQASALVETEPGRFSNTSKHDIFLGHATSNFKLKNYKKAEQYYQLCLALPTDNDKARKIQKSILYFGMAQFYFATEQVDSLVKYRDKYIQFMSNEFNLSSSAYHMEALYENDLGLFDKQKVIRLLPQLKQKTTAHQIGRVYSQLAKHYFEKNQFASCVESIDSSLIYFVQKEYRLPMLDLRHKAYQKMGNYQSAFVALKNYNLVNREVLNASSLSNTNELRIKYEAEQKEHKILEQTIQLNHKKATRNTLFTILVSISLLIFALRQRYKRKFAEADRQKKLSNQKVNALELKSLRAQMNPHFLFNTLNAINWYIIKNKSRDASKYLTKFAKLMRQILENSRSDRISLSQELESLSLYVALEAIRFEGQFEFDLKLAPGLSSNQIVVPPLIFQPFVENAIWHGLLHKKDPGKVVLKIEQVDQSLICCLKDNGIGREAAGKMQSHRKNGHISRGISITKERILSTERSGKSSITVIDLKDNNGKAAGTEVKIVLPLEKVHVTS